MTERESAHPTQSPASPIVEVEEGQASHRSEVSSRCESRLEDDVFGDGGETAPPESQTSETTTENSPTKTTEAELLQVPSKPVQRSVSQRGGLRVGDSLVPPGPNTAAWSPSGDWVANWKARLPLQTIMRLLQVLVPQVEKICIDKGLTDESEILKFLQHGTLVGLLPVPHPILIRKYQANGGTTAWFRTYMWGVVYLRNVDPPIWYDTDVKLFEIQRV